MSDAVKRAYKPRKLGAHLSRVRAVAQYCHRFYLAVRSAGGHHPTSSHSANGGAKLAELVGDVGRLRPQKRLSGKKQKQYPRTYQNRDPRRDDSSYKFKKAFIRSQFQPRIPRCPIGL